MMAWLIGVILIGVVVALLLKVDAQRVVIRNLRKPAADAEHRRQHVPESREYRARLAAATAAPDGKMRVTDADRDAVVTVLSAARESGALDAVEFDDRMSAAMESKTRKDLSGLTADLPDLP